MEHRSHKGTVELRATPTGTPVIAGYAAVFNRDSLDMGFIEQVDPGAFSKTIKEADVRALGNHDVDWLLGRSKSGTLRLFVDSVGLGYEIDINPNDPDGVRAIEKVRRGDLDGSSFTFSTIRDEWNWEASPPQRRLLEVALVDVGPVTFPAYPDATAASRALAPIAKRLGRPVDELVDAMARGEIRSLLHSKEATSVKTESRATALAVVWGPEDGVMDLLADCDTQLPWDQCTVDVTLAIDRVLVYDFNDGGGRYYVAPITVDDQNEPALSPTSEWTEVDSGWVATVPEMGERTLSRLVERRAGKMLSAESKQAIEDAIGQLRNLLDKAEGTSVADDDGDTDLEGNSTRSFGELLAIRERELTALNALVA